MGTGAAAANAVAVGTGATAANNGAAIGGGSIANQANTVSVGSPGIERRVTNVAAGVAPTDAVNLQQLQNSTSSVNSQFAAVNSRIDAVDKQAARGIAASAALAPTIMPSQNGRTTVSLSTGVYRGEAAINVGAAYRLNLSMPTVDYGSYANASGVEHIGRVGMAMEF